MLPMKALSSVPLDLSACTQDGVTPRPVHVCRGLAGLRYFGGIFLPAKEPVLAGLAILAVFPGLISAKAFAIAAGVKPASLAICRMRAKTFSCDLPNHSCSFLFSNSRCFRNAASCASTVLRAIDQSPLGNNARGGMITLTSSRFKSIYAPRHQF